MADKFPSRDSINGPALRATALTPDDGTDLVNFAKALWVGVSGDISIDTPGGDESIVLKNVQGLIPVRVARLNSTATTATDIVALW